MLREKPGLFVSEWYLWRLETKMVSPYWDAKPRAAGGNDKGGGTVGWELGGPV